MSGCVPSATDSTGGRNPMRRATEYCNAAVTS